LAVADLIKDSFQGSGGLLRRPAAEKARTTLAVAQVLLA